MRRYVQYKALLLLLVFATLACSKQATTPVAHATEVTHIQKQIVEASFKQFIRMHNDKRVDDATYAKGVAVYTKWAAGEDAMAYSLAEWKRLGDTPSGDRLAQALKDSGPLFRAYSELIGKFVNLEVMRGTIEKEAQK